MGNLGVPGRVSIVPILSVNFVGTLGFSIVLPFLIFLVTRWGGNALIYGVISATYSVFQFVGAPILGRWSDRYGRKKVLLLSQAGTLFSWILLLAAFYLPTQPLIHLSSETGVFLSLPLLVLFLARALDGLTGGNVSVAQAYLADITEEKDRSASFGRMAVSANLGFVLGPAIAGLLGATAWGELLPVLAAAVISLAATVLIVTKLPESRLCVLKQDPEHPSVRKMFGQEHKECFDIKGPRSISFKEVLTLDSVPWLLGIYFLVMLGFNFFYVAFPVYAAQGLEWSITRVGIFFSVMGLLMAAVQGPLLTYVTARFSDKSLAMFGSLFLSASFVLFLSPNSWLLYLGVALLALGNGIMWPSVVSTLSKTAGETYQGVVQGFAGSVGAGASIVGLIGGGILYEFFGARVFVLSSGMILLVFLMTFRFPGSENPANGPGEAVLR